MYSIVKPDPVAQDQIAALPADAMRYLAEALDLIEMDPWAGGPQRPGDPDGNMRTMSFGERGLVTYLVLEPQREVYIVRVHWV